MDSRGMPCARAPIELFVWRIFEARRFAENPITLAELADEFGVSRERVRQIDVNSFEKVQKAVKDRITAIETPAPLPVR